MNTAFLLSNSSINHSAHFDRLNLFTLNRLINQIPVEESSKHKSLRRTTQCTAIAIGSIGNLTFINITGKPAGDNQAYKWALVAGNAISFGALTTWVLLEIVNDILLPRSKEEEEILHAEISRALRIASKAVAIIGGVVSQIPTAYIAYVYNNSSILHPVVILTSNASLPIRSLELTFNSILTTRRYTDFEKELVSTKAALVRMLSNAITAVATMSPNQRGQFLDELQTISSTGDDRDKILQFLSKLKTLSPSDAEIDKVPNWVKFGVITSDLIGLLLSVSLLSHYWMGGYEAAKLVDKDDQALQQSSAGFVTFSNVYLTVDLVVRSTAGIFTSIANRIRNKTPMSLSMQLHPRTTLSCKSIALAAGALSYGAAVQFSRDYFSGTFGNYIEVTSAMGVAAFVTSGMLSCADAAIQKYYLYRGSDHDIKSFNFQNEITHFIEIINRCSTLDFAKALLTWHEILPAEWLTGINSPGKVSLQNFIRLKQGNQDETTYLLQDVV